MIHDVDTSLRALIRQEAIDGDDVEVAFDAPTRDWAGKRSVPTVNVYLFDIREDIQRRRIEPERVLDDDGAVIGRRRPPRRYRLSYLVTAWTQRPEDEHRLLSAVLGAFLPHDELPREFLEGALADQPQPLYTTIGLPPPPERSIGEIWSAMGGELKPSLELVLSVPFVLDELQPAGPPVTEEPRLTLGDDDGRRETTTSRRRPPGRDRPFPGPRPPDTSPSRFERALALATDRGTGDEQHGDDVAGGTGDGGRSSSKTGSATPSSTSKAKSSKPRKSARATSEDEPSDVPEEVGDPAMSPAEDVAMPPAEETISGGKEGEPGRVFTIASTDPDR